ncbi:Bestrophin-2 [Harpegnathos saltator]|uniref:Bestrophin homolog n=1 Tax=Harpegnathos saltator TaxID=610380 RepID=E2C741_HARSA|nr:Bestrophin-2 [Harpegnathos saltator]
MRNDHSVPLRSCEHSELAALNVADVRWRGSVYKLIWRELLAYLFVYYLINFTYRYLLNDQQRMRVHVENMNSSRIQ